MFFKGFIQLTPAVDKTESEPNNQKNIGLEKGETAIRRGIREINLLSLTIWFSEHTIALNRFQWTIFWLATGE